MGQLSGDFEWCAMKSDGDFGQCAANSDTTVNSVGGLGRSADAQLIILLYSYILYLCLGYQLVILTYCFSDSQAACYFFF